MEENLVNQIFQKSNELSSMIKTMREYGQTLAEAEEKYKIKLSEVALRMKAENKTATLIQLIIYGDKEVAQLRFKRDSAQVLYDAAKEEINITKLQLRLLENQMQREWGGNVNE